jgi:hypothetical protein
MGSGVAPGTFCGLRGDCGTMSVIADVVLVRYAMPETDDAVAAEHWAAGGAPNRPEKADGALRTIPRRPHPSLHVYDTPARGWYCFGRCRRGGTIYDLAAPHTA